MKLSSISIASCTLLALALTLPASALADSGRKKAPLPGKSTSKAKKKSSSAQGKNKRRNRLKAHKGGQGPKVHKRGNAKDTGKLIQRCSNGRLWFADKCWSKSELRAFAPGIAKSKLLFLGTSHKNISREDNRLYIVERTSEGERLIVVKPATQMDKRNTKIAKRGGHPIDVMVNSSTNWAYMDTNAGRRKYVRLNRAWTRTTNKRLGTLDTYTESTILLGSAGTIYTSSLGDYAHVIPSTAGESACNEPARQKKCDQWAISMRERLESQCLQNVARANKLAKLRVNEAVARTTLLNSTLVVALMMPHTMGALGAAMSTTGGAASTVSLKGLFTATVAVKASDPAKATGWAMEKEIQNAKKDAATYCSNRPKQEKLIQAALKRKNCIHVGVCVPKQLPETEIGPDAAGNCPGGTSLQPVTEVTMGYCTPSTMNCSCPPPKEAPASGTADTPNEEIVIEELQGCYTEMETTTLKCAPI